MNDEECYGYSQFHNSSFTIHQIANAGAHTAQERFGPRTQGVALFLSRIPKGNGFPHCPRSSKSTGRFERGRTDRGTYRAVLRPDRLDRAKQAYMWKNLPS